MKFPWEQDQLPAVIEPAFVQVADVRATVELMQADLRYMTTHTAVLVHSVHDELRMVVNTPRGQIIPKGVCTFNDGSTTEFQDIGMPQPGAPEMDIEELVARTWDTAQLIGLELA